MEGNRHWLTLVLAVIAGLVGGVASNYLFMIEPVFALKVPQQAKVVTTEEFRLVDTNGQPRAWLRLEADGEPRLTLADKDGAPRVELGGTRAGAARPALLLYDEHGRWRAILSLWEDGVPYLSFSDEKKVRVGLGRALFQRKGIMSNSIETTADASLLLLDKDGKVDFKAP